MGNNLAFQACGRTTAVAANSSSQQVTILSDSPCNQLLVQNPLSNAVFVTVTSNSSVAAVVPNVGNAQYAICVVPTSKAVITVPQQFSNTANTYVNVIMSTGSGTIFLTPGEGLTT